MDTARYHFIAWRRLANELGADFAEADNEQLKGVSRMESLDLILQWAGISRTEPEKLKLAEQKNEWYLEYVLEMGPEEILDGVLPFLAQVEAAGCAVALGSASKNARTILERIGLSDRFTSIIDGTRTSRSKPDPEVFLMAAQELGVLPAEAVVFEDAEKGVEAALAGGFYTVGIGDPAVLHQAQLVLPDFQGADFDQLRDLLMAMPASR